MLTFFQCLYRHLRCCLPKPPQWTSNVSFFVKNDKYLDLVILLCASFYTNSLNLLQQILLTPTITASLVSTVLIFSPLVNYTFSPQQLPGLRGLTALVDLIPLSPFASEETSLSMWMQQILEKHQQLTHLWKGFLGSQEKPRLEPRKTSLRAYVFGWPAHSGTCSWILCLYMFKHGSSQSEMEQLLCTCSGFLYLGMERFVTTIPPAKIAALNMSGIVWKYMVWMSESVCDLKCWLLYKIILVCCC